MAAVAVLLLALLVPPLVSLGRYKVQITRLMSASLGRPVHLGSIKLQLLPRPGFVLSNLTVEEDPAYGAEPVLHANSVTADIQLLPLWRGRLELSRVSVDEASLNLVRNREGRWNLDSIFRSAAQHGPRANGDDASRPVPLPYLEATDSRINIKNGLEKLPFSLVDADLSFWQENPNEWRLRVEGQPARTDVSLDLADTGVVRLEARIRRGPQLRQMPVHVDMEWSEAQLGQLSRLILGSDPGWRGDLTADFHLDGTAQAAKVTTQLRATGVHRAEFAPADPLDFDANCTFVYHYSQRSLEGLKCDSPLGDGHIEVEGDLPGNGNPRFSVNLRRISVQAGLDLLRTMRSGLSEDLEAEGAVSGKLSYDAGAPQTGATESGQAGRRRARRKVAAESAATKTNPLTGNLVVEGFQLSGGGLRQPIQIPRIELDPAPHSPGQEQALTTSFAIPEPNIKLLAITARFARSGYQITLQGPVTFARLRELASVAGLPDRAALGGFAGDPPTLDLIAEGPWLPAPEALLGARESTTTAAASAAGVAPALPDTGADRLTGTVTLQDATWKSDRLASPVEITRAMLHLAGPALRWDPVSFSYGPVKGTGTLQVPLHCDVDATCPPQLQLQFAELDAGKLQAALLGAHKTTTLLSTLLARFTSSQTPPWPQLEGTVEADSLVLGPVTMHHASAALKVMPVEARLTSFDADFLDGKIHLSGSVTSGAKPTYALQGDFSRLSAPAFCQMMGLHCSGGTVNGNGKVELAGFTDADLGRSATGELHFEWRHGAVRSAGAAAKSALPAALARFDRWTADATIADGAVKLKQNQVQQGARRATVEASVPLAIPIRVEFAEPNQNAAAHGKAITASPVK